MSKDPKTKQSERRAYTRSPCCMKLRVSHPLSGRTYQAHGIDVSPSGLLALVPGYAYLDVADPVEVHVPQSAPPLQVDKEGLSVLGQIVRIERAALESTGTVALAIQFNEDLPARNYTEKYTGKSLWRTSVDILLPGSRFGTM